MGLVLRRVRMAARAGSAVKLVQVVWVGLEESGLEPPQMEPAVPQEPRCQWRTGTVEEAAQVGIRILPGARVEMVAQGAPGAHWAMAETEEGAGRAVPGPLAPTATRWVRGLWVEMAPPEAREGSVETAGRVARSLATRVPVAWGVRAGRVEPAEAVQAVWTPLPREAMVSLVSAVALVEPVVREALEVHLELFLAQAHREISAMEETAVTVGPVEEEGTAAMVPMAMFRHRMVGMVVQVGTAVREAQGVREVPREAPGPLLVLMDLTRDSVSVGTAGTVGMDTVPKRLEKPWGMEARVAQAETTETAGMGVTVETILVIQAVLPRFLEGMAGWAVRARFQGALEVQVDQ